MMNDRKIKLDLPQATVHRLHQIAARENITVSAAAGRLMSLGREVYDDQTAELRGHLAEGGFQ